MKMEIKVEGDLFEDQDTLKIYMHAMDLHSALVDAREKIRCRRKWGEGLTDVEDAVLEELLEILWVDGVDL